MATDPRSALAALRAAAESEELRGECERLGIVLLVVHGSVTAPAPLGAPRDLDIAYRSRSGAHVLEVTEALIEMTGFEGIDVMDLASAGPVASAEALGPHSILLFESEPDAYAFAQASAIALAMETRWMRQFDLQLMAGR